MKAKIGNRLIATLKPRDTRYDVYDEAVPGFMIRVEPNGKKTFFLRYRFNGQERTQKLGRLKVDDSSDGITPAKARKDALAVLGDVRKDRDPAAAKRAARAATIGQFIEGEYANRWLLRLKSGGAKKWDSEGKSSGILRRLQACFKADFWKRALDDPRLGFAVDNWITRRANNGTARATVNKDVGALKAALNKAVEWNVISQNPLASIRPAKVDRARKVRYLTPEEEMRLMDALAAHDETLRDGRDRFNAWRRERGYEMYPDLRAVPYAGNLAAMVILSLNTGLRRGEVFNLKWGDVNLDGAMLTVEGAGAKSGTTRHVPLNSAVLAALKGWKASQQTPAEYVFPSRDGGRLDNVKKSWAALMKAAKIPAFRWHDMRHHFASRLVMAGVDLNTVRELLGHSDIKMTLRYAHLAPAVKAAAVERLVAATNIVSLQEAAQAKK